MDEAQLVDGVNGQNSLCDVELCGLLRQSVLLHQQCHHVTWQQESQVTNSNSLSIKMFLSAWSWWILCSSRGLASLHTSRQKLHDEVEVPLVLEAVEHLDHPSAVCLHQYVPLCPDVSDLQEEEEQHQCINVLVRGGAVKYCTCSFSSMSAFLKIFMA